MDFSYDVMIIHVLPKRFCNGVTHFLCVGLCCSCLALSTLQQSRVRSTLECCANSRGVLNACSAVFWNVTNPVQHHITTIFGHMFFNKREFVTDGC